MILVTNTHSKNRKNTCNAISNVNVSVRYAINVYETSITQM